MSQPAQNQFQLDTRPDGQNVPTGPLPVTTQPDANPGPSMQGASPMEPRPYETGLCDCWSNIPVCLCATFFHSCLFGRTTAMLRQKSYGDPEEDCINGACCIYFCFAPLGVLWQAARRTQIRKKYNLEGSKSKDWAVTLLCTPCALAQDDIEVRLRERELTMTEKFSKSNV